MASARLFKLTKHLDAVVHGRLPVTSHNASLFLEAISVQQDRPSCINKLIASKCGLDAVQAAMRCNITPDFLNGPAASFLSYLRAPDLKDVAGGLFLDEIVMRIVDPPIFWDAFSLSFTRGLLSNDAQVCFAWLLHHLVSLPASTSNAYRNQACTLVSVLQTSPETAVRNLGQRIDHVLSTRNAAVTPTSNARDGPGGRHDNDHTDFRDIAILPTSEEIKSREPPFLRPSDALDDPSTEHMRLSLHLDNQFRLLREDMLYEMREELEIAFGKKKGNHRGLVLNGLTPLDIYCGPDNKRCKWGVTLRCNDDLPQLKNAKDRRKFLNDNRNLLRHQSLTCLMVDGEILAFPTINRDEELLARKPSVVVLQFEGEVSTSKVLLKLKTAKAIKLIQIDTAVFSYAPVLSALQHITSMPLSPELFLWKDDDTSTETIFQPSVIVQALRKNPKCDLKDILKTSKTIRLDQSQADSLISGLTQRVSLIQGPPGTGKSFIGALIAKSIHDFTHLTIMVVCYTNHALDDILTGLLDIGIPSDSMVRLGGKSTSRTEAMTMQKQKSTFRRDKAAWAVIDRLKSAAETFREDLEEKFSSYLQSNVAAKDILDHLEFESSEFFEAFRVPQTEDGSTLVGVGGKAVTEFYLLQQWERGHHAGIFRNEPNVEQASHIWTMRLPDRREQLDKWRNAILQEQVDDMYAVASKYNSFQDQLARQWAEKDTEILRSKRIIGCTTTAAAKYSDSIQSASPDVLLVEEAGEILESHVLTALGSKTSQLVMIGDHKQLRPKVNHYKLTVEKGDGYDLNRSLFERLIIKGYPHEKLTQQHRMRPEISELVRALTYPELVDAPKTQGRANLRGVQDNIVFISHDHPEDNSLQLADRRDGESTSSKQNSYEVQMVLKILRYLAQQGYGTDTVVILTPYLGQLQKLQSALKQDNDPILNDLDSFDLVRAGLLSPVEAKMSKKPIRLATIDNYQGEESDIVIISLTRSNPQNDIGFMFSPERLNVLLSRARNALIMIGNAKTFMNSRKGGELWRHLFDLLRKGKHIYEGMPVQCDRHNDRKALLRRPEDFDLQCPDGGCMEPCGTMLKCGQHPCLSKCHQISDHSKMLCLHILLSSCPNGHEQSWKCCQGGPITCKKCEHAAKAAAEKSRKDFELQQKKDADQLAHKQAIDALNGEIAKQEQIVKDASLAEERANALRSKEKDLVAAKARATQAQDADTSANPTKVSPAAAPQKGVFDYLSTTFGMTRMMSGGNRDPSPDVASSDTLHTGSDNTIRATPVSKKIDKTFPPIAPSPSQMEWQRQKVIHGAENEAIDVIMAMIGLETVKSQVLAIKDTIDTRQRQGASFKHERLNLVLLGNPGTGKTTVARHYAKFLTSLQVLPGNAFVETTGSRLANDGVPGIKKIVEETVKAGGGAIFIDEAYQLTSEHNFQGKQVLDFLLAEMENNTGVLVFILAGYNKEMEKFFEHNPGLQSRVPYKLQFDDYSDSEFLAMFEKIVEKRYAARMKMQLGPSGLYVRIAIRRLGRGRGKEGFGNARQLENMLSQIFRRQAKRLTEERRRRQYPDDFLLTKEDLIGTDPSKAILQCEAWTELQKMIGLQSVKEAVQTLIDSTTENYHRELEECKPLEMSLNRTFLGSPGTGKTTVAKLYGKILADLGLISNGEVVTKNPADFIGSVLGESERKTKAILASTIGKVLIIDEAYMLYGGGAASGSGNTSDIYKTAVIDTIVAEVQSVPGEDRCVLLLGYKEQMTEMFQNVNPGLTRRFAIEDAFNFEDFDNAQLLQILDMKLKSQDLSATNEAKATAIQVLDRARNRPNFGNGGEVENILRQAKTRYMRRTKVSRGPRKFVFDSQDFDPDFDRDAHASDNLARLFKDVVGCEEVVKRLESYQHLARAMKTRNMDPREEIPTNFVFKGPPGTGKTTIARKMGEVYYDLGFLNTKEIIECSASDLVGQYVGHTGPKTKKLLEKALGRVLFVDEAYRLAEGRFAQEAMDELVGLLTQEKFKSKLIVILAGYDQDMNKLMAVNSGLASRFPEHIQFRNMEPSRCLELLHKELTKKKILVQELESPSCKSYIQMKELIEELSTLPSWGNARDILTLSKTMIKKAFLADADAPPGVVMIFPVDAAIACIEEMLKEQQERCTNVPRTTRTASDPLQRTSTPPRPSPPNIQIAPPEMKKSVPNPPRTTMNPAVPSDGRDPGVTDAVWNELQAAKKREEQQAQKGKGTAKKLQRDINQVREALRQQERIVQELARAVAKDQAEREELKRKREAARLKDLEARRRAAQLEGIRRRKEEEKKKEERNQAALQRMGVCVAGYQWINMGSGYRCAGGSHFISNAQLPS